MIQGALLHSCFAGRAPLLIIRCAVARLTFRMVAASSRCGLTAFETLAFRIDEDIVRFSWHLNRCRLLRLLATQYAVDCRNVHKRAARKVSAVILLIVSFVPAVDRPLARLNRSVRPFARRTHKDRRQVLRSKQDLQDRRASQVSTGFSSAISFSNGRSGCA
jgi:hypothetical protein